MKKQNFRILYDQIIIRILYDQITVSLKNYFNKSNLLTRSVLVENKLGL